MHARVISAQFPTGSDDVAETATRAGMRKIGDMDGNRGTMILLDRSGGRILAVTLWEDEQAMKASEDASGAVRTEAANQASGNLIAVDYYEVAALGITGEAGA